MYLIKYNQKSIVKKMHIDNNNDGDNPYTLLNGKNKTSLYVLNISLNIFEKESVLVKLSPS